MMVAEAQINNNTINLLEGWEEGLDKAPEWVQSFRKKAADDVMKTGLPTPAWEDWKYTNLRNLESVTLCEASSLHVVPNISSPFIDLKPIIVQLFNGSFVGEMPDLPDGLMIAPINEVWTNDWFKGFVSSLSIDTPMEALNSAFLNDGIVIKVSENTKIAEPLLLLSTYENSKDMLSVMPRIVIILENNAELNIVEHQSGIGSYVCNQATSINLGEKSKLGHYILQDNDRTQGYLFNTTKLNCYDDAVYDGFSLNHGAKLSRHEIFADLLGERIECIINGAYNLISTQHHDTTIKTGHFSPNSISKQIYKGVINHEASAVFQGRICVHNDAQGTDGHQLNRTLLLSEKAEFNAKPELKIYADDVKCSHGVTSGDLNDEELFYLRSRGIPEIEAKQILTKAFVAEVIEGIKDSVVRDIFLSISIEEGTK